MEAFCPVDAQVSASVDRDLFALLDGLADPRRSRWRRHPLGYVLAVVFTAFAIPGFESLAGVAQWAADPARTRRELLGLGAWVDPFDGRVWPPSEPTIRTILTGIDPDALTAACVAWTLSRLHPDADNPQREQAGQQGARTASRLKALAMDGKAARGARRADGSMPQVMAAVTHQVPVVVGQRAIPDKTSEIRCVSTLLVDLQAAGWDLASTVITLDALHTIRDTAQKILAADANYLMIVKGNRADLYARCAQVIAHANPVKVRRHVQAGRGHGRTEQRHLVAVDVTGETGIDFPGASQILRIIRYTGGLDGQRATKEIVYAITGLTADQADAPALSVLARGHWGIEALHYVRDVTMNEDASHARTGTLPVTLTVIRNTVIAALRLAGATNIAHARRWAAGATHRIINLYTGTQDPDICPL